MKWWVAAPSGPEKLDDGEPRRSGKTTTITQHVLGEPSQSKRSPTSMNTRNPNRITSALSLPASEEKLGRVIKEDGVHGGGRDVAHRNSHSQYEMLQQKPLFHVHIL
ncbi:hypothetical protein EVAR_27494_1 [Eumeta japonica]|uniref:Uncharacterized protein n=1 Tax=Eumeta variegata TaxID=151549 RepID=A0A4C1XHC2_EUMVA|nr:hypothetical protein EVAR_27494_1 [Eumeta japonica]